MIGVAAAISNDMNIKNTINSTNVKPDFNLSFFI